MKFWHFCFCVAPIFATVNEPLRIELFSGYRNDRLHWHLQEGGTGTLNYSEKYRDLQFWENGLRWKVIHRDLVFSIQGSHAAFGMGSLFQNYTTLNFTPNPVHFRFQTHGWAADASGYFSYAVNLTSDRTYKVIFLPLIGYSGHFEQIWQNKGRPDPFTSNQAIGAESFTMHSSLPSRLDSNWYGVFIGGGFLIEPGGRLIFQAGYSYHWLNEYFKAKFKNTVALFSPDLISQTETSNSFRTKGNGNIGQTGWAQIDCILTPDWRVGLGALIHYFSSTLLETNLKQQTTSIMPAGPTVSTTISQKLKVRWTPISGWVTVSREL